MNLENMIAESLAKPRSKREFVDLTDAEKIGARKLMKRRLPSGLSRQQQFETMFGLSHAGSKALIDFLKESAE